MERKYTPISLDDFRRRFGNRTNPEGQLTPLQQISAAQKDAQQLLQRAQDRFARIDEDAYTTRNEAWQLITFLGAFTRKIAKIRPGSTVNLTKTVIDEGYDPEEAAAAQDAGVDYQTAADRAEAEYTRNLSEVGRILPRLEKAGVRVEVGFRRVFREEFSKYHDTSQEF